MNNSKYLIFYELTLTILLRKDAPAKTRKKLLRRIRQLPDSKLELFVKNGALKGFGKDAGVEVR